MSKPAVVELAVRTCKNLNQSLLLSCGWSNETSQFLQGELSPLYPVCYCLYVCKKQCELYFCKISLEWKRLSQRSFHLLKCKNMRIYIHDTRMATELTGAQSWIYTILVLKISGAAGCISASCIQYFELCNFHCNLLSIWRTSIYMPAESSKSISLSAGILI